jgi:hypothetical protein
LQRQAASFLPPNEQMAVTAAWVELIRSGEALRLLFESLVPHTAPGPGALNTTPDSRRGVHLIVWCRDSSHQIEPDPAEQEIVATRR